LDTLSQVGAISAEVSRLRSKNTPTSRAIDGNVRTYTATSKATMSWLSVRIPAATPVGYVAFYNRQSTKHAKAMGTVAAYVGSSSGDTTSSDVTFCGEVSYRESHEPAPYVLWCGGAQGEYVTFRRTGRKSNFWIAEVRMYKPAVPTTL
jgi:hypothetical protein